MERAGASRTTGLLLFQWPLDAGVSSRRYYYAHLAWCARSHPSSPLILGAICHRGKSQGRILAAGCDTSWQEAISRENHSLAGKCVAPAAEFVQRAEEKWLVALANHRQLQCNQGERYVSLCLVFDLQSLIVKLGAWMDAAAGPWQARETARRLRGPTLRAL